VAQAVLWNGPVLELHGRSLRRLGPDILGADLDLGRVVARFRRERPFERIGDALLDQRLVSGIGNVWKAESLWHAQLSPWARLGEVADEELRSVLGQAAKLMRASLEQRSERRAVYRRAGRPCPRCATPIRSRGQGDDNRTAYWCPGCQRGEERPGA
jgi:endonuclease VIII